mgnify:CR=1 FL=1
MIAGEEVLEYQHPDDECVDKNRRVGGVGEMDSNGEGGNLSKEQGASKEACLLYTSPSPRDRTRSRMPSSA